MQVQGRPCNQSCKILFCTVDNIVFIVKFEIKSEIKKWDNKSAGDSLNVVD